MYLVLICFFKAVAKNANLKRFILASVSQDESLGVWVGTICGWLQQYCGEEFFSYLELKTAIGFSMSGTMHLFIHQDELGLDYRSFCRKHIETILGFLRYEETEIAAICDLTDKRMQDVDVREYLDYCAANISWMLL